MAKSTGTNTSSSELSPRARKRAAEKRRREEKRWARKSGAVTTRYVCPLCGGPHSRQDHGVTDVTEPPAKPSVKRGSRNPRPVRDGPSPLEDARNTRRQRRRRAP